MEADARQDDNMQKYTTDMLPRPPQKYNDDNTDGAVTDNATTPFRGVSKENSSNQSEDFSGYHEAHDGTEGKMKGVPSEDDMKEDDGTEKDTDGSTPINEGEEEKGASENNMELDEAAVNETDGSNVKDKRKQDEIIATPVRGSVSDGGEREAEDAAATKKASERKSPAAKRSHGKQPSITLFYPSLFLEPQETMFLKQMLKALKGSRGH